MPSGSDAANARRVESSKQCQRTERGIGNVAMPVVNSAAPQRSNGARCVWGFEVAGLGIPQVSNITPP
jgi:hypothetical protein